jgi:hypothetical protein
VISNLITWEDEPLTADSIRMDIYELMDIADEVGMADLLPHGAFLTDIGAIIDSSFTEVELKVLKLTIQEDNLLVLTESLRWLDGHIDPEDQIAIRDAADYHASVTNIWSMVPSE